MNKSNLIKVSIWIVVTLIVVISLIYYGTSYLKDYELSFTIEHKFILAIFSVSVLIMIILCLFILYKNNRLEKLLYRILDELAEIEDNHIEFSRITQNMIMKLLNKNGAD